MRLDHSEVLLDFEGTPLKEAIDNNDPPTLRDVTFRSLVVTALNTIGPNDRLTAEDKARCYQISLKFFKGKFAKLTVDEAAFIKQRVEATLLSPLGVGRVNEWLEGQPQTLASDEDDDTEEVQHDDD